MTGLRAIWEGEGMKAILGSILLGLLIPVAVYAGSVEKAEMYRQDN